MLYSLKFDLQFSCFLLYWLISYSLNYNKDNKRSSLVNEFTSIKLTETWLSNVIIVYQVTKQFCTNYVTMGTSIINKQYRTQNENQSSPALCVPDCLWPTTTSRGQWSPGTRRFLRTGHQLLPDRPPSLELDVGHKMFPRRGRTTPKVSPSMIQFSPGS